MNAAMYCSLSDEAVIERIQSGEKEWYELIMRRYNPKLFRVGIAILKDESETEEAIQETYVKAYEKLNRFEHRSSFSTWLIRIMINEALARLRQKSHVFLFEQDEYAEALWHSALQKKDERTPEQIMLNNELRTVLERAILGLPEKYRLVYMLREVEKISVQETSDALNISESNVKVRLNRARNLLRQHISQLYSETEVFSFHLTRCNRIVEAVMNRI